MRRLRVQFALTVEEFEARAEMDTNTAKKLFRGQKVSLYTLKRAAKVFGITNHQELLHPDELAALGVDPTIAISAKGVLEWDLLNYLSDFEKTANGFQYCVAKFQHRYRKTRFARGKCYWLQHLPVSDRNRLEENLTGIAEGLKALHQEKIIRRELSPRFVIVRNEDHQPILTDFELAKLLEGKTVRPKDGWQDDPYRAIEVAGEGTIDERADVYSWGRIFVEAATGQLPTKGTESDHLTHAAIPDALKKLVLRCVAKPRSDRPDGMDEILKALKRWSS